MLKITASLDEKLQALRACPYFASLGDDILSELSAGMTLFRCARAEILFWQEDPCAGLHIIRRGSVKLFKVSPQGRELIVRVIEEGASFNEVSVFDDGGNPVNAAALEESELWVVQANIIRQALSEHPAMAQAVIVNLTRNLRMLVGIVEELSFYQVTHRLARLLSQLPPEQLAGQSSSRLTQDQLAARLGTVREVVARSLRELERSGAIHVARREIYVVDSGALQQWVQTQTPGI